MVLLELSKQEYSESKTYIGQKTRTSALIGTRSWHESRTLLRFILPVYMHPGLNLSATGSVLLPAGCVVHTVPACAPSDKFDTMRWNNYLPHHRNSVRATSFPIIIAGPFTLSLIASLSSQKLRDW
jgi:hypothetical protein